MSDVGRARWWKLLPEVQGNRWAAFTDAEVRQIGAAVAFTYGSLFPLAKEAAAEVGRRHSEATESRTP